MFIEADNPRRVSLTEYVGMLVLAVPVRWLSHERMLVEFGEAGVWYIPSDYCETSVKLEPLADEEEEGSTRSRYLYRLQPKPLSKHHCLHDHRYLVRYWDSDVYVPKMISEEFSIREHNSEGGGPPIWELHTPKMSIWGVDV